MKKGVVSALVLMPLMALAKITVSDVEVFSGWPWQEVVIGYKITGSTDKTIGGLEVTAKDNVTGKTYVCKTLEGVDITPGNHIIKWNASGDGVKFQSNDVAFTVRILRPLYCVIDLSDGVNATSYPVMDLADVPSCGWTDEYKTTKLVLRRIEAGTFKMQNKYEVTLTKPFHIGVFEVTQKQYELVTGSNPSQFKGDMRPVEKVSYDTIRGSSTGSGWPTNNLVDADTFLGKLRTKTGLDFDLPTEAQWEYACRAGTTSDYNNGGSSEDDLKKLGRYGDWYINDGKGGYTEGHAKVGSYRPNAWGLYDMHGNVQEWCLDWYESLGAATDPNGPVSSLRGRVRRGGCFYDSADACTSSCRDGNHLPLLGTYNCGFRISRTMQDFQCESSSGSGTVDTTFKGLEQCVNTDIPIAHGSIAPYSSCKIVIDGIVSHEVSSKGSWNWKPTFVREYDLEWRVGDAVMRSSIPVTTRIGEGVVSNGCAIIPEGATDILEGAFANRDDLVSVTIPNSMTNIGADAFIGCENLKRVDVATLEDWLNIEFANAAANPLNCGAALYVGGKEMAELVVPAGTTEIGECAFAGGQFMSVTIPDSVTKIAPTAFAGCLNVENVVLPLEFKMHGPAGFYEAEFSNMDSYSANNDLKGSARAVVLSADMLTADTIAERTMYGYAAYMWFEGGVTYEFLAHYDDRSSVKVDDAWIIQAASSDCQSQTGSVKFEEDGWRWIEVRGWNNGGPGATNFGADAGVKWRRSGENWRLFADAGDGALFSVEKVPPGVRGLLPDSYKNVKSVELIGAGNEVPDEFLKGCTALESVTIPDCVTSIAPTAFAECPNIVEVSVSDGLRVDTIEQRERLPEVSGDWAQESDETCRSRTIGHSQSSQMKATIKVDESCEYVFQWKVSSESSYDWLSYSVDGNGQSGRISGNKDWQSVKVPLSAGTHEIVWTYAKDYVGTSGSDCGWVKLGTINETVAVSYTKTLADIFPDSVAGIERATVGSRDGCIHGQFFAGCASLKSVEVSDAVRRIDAGAFDDCTALESVVFPSELKDFGLDLIPEAMRGSLGYDDDGFMIKDGWLLDYKEKGASEVVVPEGVIGIGHFALAYMADLERVSLPSTLKYIASAAFVEDTYLDDVAIPDSVEYIGKDAFLRCSWVQSLTFGAGVREIADRAFAGCTKLAEAELPEGLGEVGDAAFSNCWRMVSVSLPLSVSNVATTAFRDCASLTDVTVSTMAVPMSDWFAPVYRRIEHVTVPTGMTEVRAEMFAGCVALKAVELPEGVTNLASGAFRDCAALEAIRLPESLETVGDEAFAGCAALKSVVLPKKVGVLGKRVFGGCAALSDVRLSRGLTAIPDETFIGCDALALFVVPETVTALGSRIVSSATTAIYYLGNAPAYAADAYAQANASLVSYVVEGTRGWDGLPTSRDLPQGWPASNARAITTWAPDQCMIRFHANYGADATTDQPFTYGAPVTLAKSSFVRAGYSMSGWATSAKGEVVYADGETLEEMPTVPAGVVHLYAVWEDATVETPVVVPGDGAIFKSETCTVTIACGTEGAAVYYRVGAAPKASSKFLYSAPFEISETSTIYTYALKDGTSSTTNVVTLTKGHVLTFVEAASAEGIAAFALGGDAEWTAEEDANAKVGNASVRSGEIDDDQISWFTAEVEGPGTLSFWWKASCEEDELQDFDHLVFAVDDVVEGEVARLDGITAWERISTTVPAGSHTLYWAYVKDESDFDGEDCGWVDGIMWTPSGSPAVAPTIEGDEGATVTGDAETGFVVKPSEGKTAVEVTIPQGVDAAKVTVEVSPKVASVKPNGAKVKVVSGGADITEFLNVPAVDGNGVVNLTKATVKEEIVKETMDPAKGAKIELNAANPTLTTPNTRIGLFYTFSEGRTLGGMERSASKTGDGKPWSPEIKVKGGNSAFYSIGVGKGE